MTAGRLMEDVTRLVQDYQRRLSRIRDVRVAVVGQCLRPRRLVSMFAKTTSMIAGTRMGLDAGPLVPVSRSRRILRLLALRVLLG